MTWRDEHAAVPRVPGILTAEEVAHEPSVAWVRRSHA